MVKNIGIDKILIAVTTLLILFGLIMVYSSTMIMAKEKYDDSFHFLKKHLIWLSLGLLIFGVIIGLKYPVYLNKKFVIFALSFSIIGLVLVFFSGKINNCYRWIRIGQFSLQPSEFAKISIILYLSYFLGRNKDVVNNKKRLLIILLPLFIIELLILKEPDYGSFFLILVLLVIMLYVAGFKLRYFLGIFLFMLPVFHLMIKVDPDKIKRILAYMNPEAYITTYSFQTMQSIYAVGSGGIFGQGLGKSTQKLFFLPYAYSDFIFSIIGEEVGLIGASFIVGLFFVFFFRGIRIAKHSGNKQTYLLVTGLTFLVVLQAFMNISVTIGIFPAKGLPLPFISNGGSSLIATLVVTAIVLNVSRHRKTVLLND